MRWAYGVTTVPARLDDLLPKTLNFLAAAGFDKPRLFIDGAEHKDSRWSHFGLETTLRYPTIRAYGNWILALGELFIRNPVSERYAIFQDDFICVKNLRGYLDQATKVKRSEKVYWNLYTFPMNQHHLFSGGGGKDSICNVCRGKKEHELHHFTSQGFYGSNQLGRSAIGLVFSREAVITLLSKQSIIQRPANATRGWKVIDGAVLIAMVESGYKELVHNPSLTQHVGHQSTIENSVQKQAISFPGPSFDALDFLPKISAT